MIKIYVLQLEENNFYIGQTKDIDKRFEFHQKKKLSSEWTKIFKPIKIVEVIETTFSETNEAMFLENSITIEYMKKYGWRNVRGGDFCTLNQDKLRFLLCKNSDIQKDLLPIENSKKFNLNLFGHYLFVLKLKNSNYFIGRTKNLKLAILNECNGLGSDWTKTHKPIELISVLDVSKKEDIKSYHNSIVIQYMKKYGFKNIRGGDFFNIDERNHKNKVLNYTDIFKPI